MTRGTRPALSQRRQGPVVEVRTDLIEQQRRRDHAGRARAERDACALAGTQQAALLSDGPVETP